MTRVDRRGLVHDQREPEGQETVRRKGDDLCDHAVLAATRGDDPLRGRIQSQCGLRSGDADGLASIPTCNTGAGPETHRATGIELLRMQVDNECIIPSEPGFGAYRPTTKCIAASVETCSFTL